MPIKLNSTGGGSVTIDVPNMSTANTLTLPAITGNVITSSDSNTVTQSMISRSSFYGGFGPAFSAYCSATNQTVSSATWTKVQINTEEFDTASCFDSTTNYRFTPNVAGYYQINFTVATLATSSMTVYAGAIYKNGTLLKYSGINGSFSANAANLTSLAQLIYLNGSTDYIEFYGFVTGTGTLSIYGSQTYLTAASGFLARPA